MIAGSGLDSPPVNIFVNCVEQSIGFLVIADTECIWMPLKMGQIQHDEI